MARLLLYYLGRISRINVCATSGTPAESFDQMLRFAEEITLLLLDDEGKECVRLPMWPRRMVFAAAVLMDLALENCIDTDLDRLFPIDPKPLRDALLDPTLARIAQVEKARDTRYWLEQIAGIWRRYSRACPRPSCRTRHSAAPGHLFTVDVPFALLPDHQRQRPVQDEGADSADFVRYGDPGATRRRPHLSRRRLRTVQEIVAQKRIGARFSPPQASAQDGPWSAARSPVRCGPFARRLPPRCRSNP